MLGTLRVDIPLHRAPAGRGPYGHKGVPSCGSILRKGPPTWGASYERTIPGSPFRETRGPFLLGLPAENGSCQRAGYGKLLTCPARQRGGGTGQPAG